MTDVRLPDTLADATSPAWLAAVLGEEVVSVTVGEVDERVSTNAPVTVELAGGRTRRLWIKGYFNELGKPYRFTGIPEALFYRDLVATTGVRTLDAVFADVDDETQANVLVTADVSGGEAAFLHARCEYSVDQAAETLDQLATLHAATWLDEGLADVPWLEPRLELYAAVRGVAEISTNFDGPIGAGAPESVRDAVRLHSAYVALATEDRTGAPWCVIHGDPHIGNVYLDDAGRPSLVDWQLVQRGPWYLDVGYHIGSVLTVEDRRRAEVDLVHRYLERLEAGGVPLPSDDEVWRGFRRGLLHGFYLWGITFKVDPRKTAVMLERLGTAVADHDAYAEVGF